MAEKNFFCNNEIELETLNDKVSRKIIARGGDMMMVEAHFKKGGGGGNTHNHHHEQTTYCIKGKFEFIIGDERKIISVGDSLYMEPNIPHGCKALEDDSILLDVFAPQREDFLK